jgi:membrane protease YdiL (CAAX protease family)
VPINPAIDPKIDDDGESERYNSFTETRIENIGGSSDYSKMMIKLKNLIERHSLASYFVLAYTIAWGGMLAAVGPGGLAPAPTRAMQAVLLVFVAMLLGPSVASLTLTAVLEGKAGLKALFSRWRRWRFNWRWYAAALLTTPVLLLALGALRALVAPVFIPRLLATSDTATVLGFGLTIGLLAGGFEEIGWSGFATPRMLSRRGALATGLALGLLWGSWHVLGDYWGNAGTFGALYPLRGLLWVSTLTAYRMLMVQVYSKTASLGLMQLMHASFTAGQAILEPALAPADYLLWYGAFSAALWTLAALVAIGQRRAAPAPRPQMGKP